MPRSEVISLLLWSLLMERVLCGELTKIAQQPSNILVDYYAYRHVSIIHFDVPERSAAAVFKFTVKEEKTGGIGRCPLRNVSLYLKSGSLPFVRPDGSKVAAKLMSRRRRHYNIETLSGGDPRIIKIDAPPSGDWYTIAFRSSTNPDNDKITQQGLGASCDTVLDAELFVETASVSPSIDIKDIDEIQLNKSSDTSVIRFHVPTSLDNALLSLTSSCGEDCKLAAYVTAEDQLADIILNSTEAIIAFRPYTSAFHYLTLRLLTGEATNVTVQLSDVIPIEQRQINRIDLIRKTLPEFFLFDYEHLRGNNTKPSPFNITADVLTVLSFEIGQVYDVGGTMSLGLKLIDVDEKLKKNIFVVACVSLGYYSDVTSGGSCIRERSTTLPDLKVNASGPMHVHIPFPEAGMWHISLRALHIEENCQCGNACLNGTICKECNCTNWSSARVESDFSSSPCIEGRCGSRGKCMHYMSGGFVFSACHCTDGYRGFDCADSTYVLSNGSIILRLLTLTLSNLGFAGSVYVAIRREYFTEAIVYAAVMFFSTFYHACEAGEDVFSVCIMRLSVLQFCDFFNALLSIWVTLVAMASFGPRLTAFCQIAGAVVLAMSAEMDRTALWVFLLPAITGSALIGMSWGYRCKRRRTVRYPLRPYRIIYFPAGLFVVSLGLVCYAFLQTRSNYYLVHSFWHICVAVGVILLLPKRQYVK